MRYKLFHAALRSISFSGIIFLTIIIHSLRKKADSGRRGFSLLCDSNKHPQTQIELTTFINNTLHALRHSTLIIHISRQSQEIAIWSILSFIHFLDFLPDSQHSNQSIWIDTHYPSSQLPDEVLSRTVSESKVDMQVNRVSADMAVFSDHLLFIIISFHVYPTLSYSPALYPSQVPQVCG